MFRLSRYRTLLLCVALLALSAAWKSGARPAFAQTASDALDQAILAAPTNGAASARRAADDRSPRPA